MPRFQIKEYKFLGDKRSIKDFKWIKNPKLKGRDCKSDQLKIIIVKQAGGRIFDFTEGGNMLKTQVLITTNGKISQELLGKIQGYFTVENKI